MTAVGGLYVVVGDSLQAQVCWLSGIRVPASRLDSSSSFAPRSVPGCGLRLKSSK